MSNIKQPPLFNIKPETVIGNIEGVCGHFKNYGLTTEMYLKAALKRPPLFSAKPKTIIGKIDKTYSHFKNDGLTIEAYLKAAIKWPTLFTQLPETTANHINLAYFLYEKGFLGDLEPKTLLDKNVKRDTKRVIDFLLKYPGFLSLSDKNYILRAVHTVVTGMQHSPVRFFSKRNNEMNINLREALWSEETNANKETQTYHISSKKYKDLDIPIPKVCFPGGAENLSREKQHRIMGPHSRNLLLRALIREGMIKGKLEDGRDMF